MNTITLNQINKVKKDIDNLTNKAKKRLFELETLANLYEIQQGKWLKFESSASLLRSLKK